MGGFMFDKTQLMKGILEGCILKIISRNTTYGYEILETLRKIGIDDISEGSIYPILLRLERQQNIVSEFRPSPLGPRRKYYTITKEGNTYLTQFYENWESINKVTSLLFEEDTNECDK